jgi:hypothetical protein
MSKLDGLRRMREERALGRPVVRAGATVTNRVVSNERGVTNVVTNDADRPTSTARVKRWKAAHRRSWNEYMKLYMRDWRCRRATLRSSDG